MIKVLQILDRPEENDTSRVVLDVCRNARRFGIEVHLALLGDGPLSDEFVRSGAVSHIFERGTGLDLICAYKIRRLLSREGISVIHSYGLPEAVHAMLATFGTRSTRKILSHPGPVAKENKVLGKLLLRSVARAMNANLLPLRTSFKRFRQMGISTSDNFYYLPQCVDATRLDHSGRSFREGIGLKRKDKLMGMIASFDDESGVDPFSVCKSLREVFNKVKDSYFVFVGGSGEDLLDECVEFCNEANIGDRVFFAGESINSAAVLDALDVFIYSTVEEDNLPLSLIEAMTVGVPVIVSDTESLTELTDGGRCSGVFVREDSEELSERMISLLTNPKLKQKRRSDALMYAADKYSVDSHLSSLKALYLEPQYSASSNNKEMGPTVDDERAPDDSVLVLN